MSEVTAHANVSGVAAKVLVSEVTASVSGVTENVSGVTEKVSGLYN